MPRLIGNIRLAIILSLTLVLSVPMLTFAQETSIEFPGEINAIDGNVIIVGGIAVDTSNAILPADGLSVGMQVQVIGTRQDQTIIATIIVITDFGVSPTPVPPSQDATPTIPATLPPPTAEATVAPPTLVPTIDATVAPTQIPTAVATADSTTGVPIIVIEGPVQAINVTSITIFDIDIQVDPASTVLTQIRIGDTVRVEGASSFDNNTIVIVAVDITIIQTTLVVVQNIIVDGGGSIVYVPSLPSNCKRTRNGKVTCRKKTSKKTS